MSRMATPGSQLPGGFVLGRLSHADRVGLVYRAHHPEHRNAHTASAFVLHPLHVDELRDWFERMAVLGRSLRHPNLVEVYALGYTSNDLPVVVSEWVEGKTTRNELASGRVFAPSEVARIVQEVASALDYLHQRSPPVFHRMLMPETVLLSSPSGAVRVLAVGHADRPHHPANRASYLSPEELAGEGMYSPASDVFSLASFAYELLTGTPAFTGSPHTILAAIYRAAFPRVSASEGASETERVLHRAWAADPARRHTSAGAFADALGSALEHLTGVVTGARRTLPPGAMRAPTFPPTAGAAGVATATARFASATFHADALTAQRPFAATASGQPPNVASRWTPAVGLSSPSPLIRQGAATAARLHTPPSPAGRSSGVQRSLQDTASVVVHDTLRASATGAVDAPTTPGHKEQVANDVVPPGALDDSLLRSMRFIDDAVQSSPPTTPRKEPLFAAGVPRAATLPATRVVEEALPDGMRRNSGEFPPAVVPTLRKGTTDPGVVPVLLTATRAPSAQVGALAPKPREPSEAPTTRYQASTESSPVVEPAAPSKVATAPRVTQTVNVASASEPKRTVFERDVFAPAPEKEPRDTPHTRGEVRFTWPVVFGLLSGHAALTAALVFGLGQVAPSRTPAVVYVSQPVPQITAADLAPSVSAPSANTATLHALQAPSEPTASPSAPTVPVIVGPSTPPTLGAPTLAPLQIEPLTAPSAVDAGTSRAPTVAVVPPPTAPVPVAHVPAPTEPTPSVVAPVPDPAPVVVHRRRRAWSPLQITAPWPAPTPTTAPTAPAEPVTAPPPPVISAPTPRPAGGANDPPPNPY